MSDNKISIIEPVGGYGGMNYTTHGYCLGLISNNWKPFLFTCNDTINKFSEIETVYSFGDIWSKKNKFIKLLLLVVGYINSFKISSAKKVSVINLHFFSIGPLDSFILFLARVFFNGKIIVTIHDVESFNYNTSKYVAKIGIRFVDGFIFFNDFCKKEFTRIYGLSKPYCLVSHGNYLHYFKKLPHRKRKTDKKINLLFFGQLKKVKGIEILLEAFKIVCEKSQDFNLVVVGRPWKVSKKYIVDKFNSYDFKDNFDYELNYVSDSKAISYYKNSDIVILPYTKIYNSAVMLLSFSYGRTIISSDLEPFLERVIDGINGFIFKSGDANSLAQKILSTLNYDLNAMGDKSYETVKNKNDWNIESHKLVKFIETL